MRLPIGASQHAGEGASTPDDLAPIDRMAKLALAKAIDEATGDEADLPTSGATIALPGADNAGLIATILPLERGERQSIRGTFSGMVAIFVQDPIVMPPFIPGQAFAELYGLTTSELRVLLTMAPGLSVKEAAEMLGGSARTRPRPTCNTFTRRPAPRSRPSLCVCS